MSAESPPWLKLLQSRTGKVGPAARATRAELWIALAIVLAVCTLPVGRAIVDGSRIFCAVDAATVQSPWSKTPVATSTERDTIALPATAVRATDPLLVEQGCELYPSWRYTIEELAAQRLPAWNPLLGAGVPWLADPTRGVLDPQVLTLVALEIVGGQGSSDHGFAWTAWLRLTAATFGAYVLARRLGLSSVGAALAAAGFGGSAACLVSVNMPAGHVAAVVPWLFVALDRLRDQASLRGLALVALATAFLVLGGDVETAFFAGCAALAWTACVLHGRERWLGIGGLGLGTFACAPLLVPFVEALQHSRVLVERRAMIAAATHFDFVAMGLVVVTAGLVAAWRALDAADKSGTRGLAGTVGVVFALCACAFTLSGRGLGAVGRALFLYDAHGSLGSGWRGAGAFSETIVAWVPAVVVALALASYCSSTGPLHARKIVQVVGLCALLLAIGTPGIVDVWHRVPFFGAGAPMKAAAVAALLVSLLAGEALDAAPRAARRTAGLAFVALVTLALVERPVGPKLEADRSEPFLTWTETPPAAWTKGDAFVAGQVGDELRCDALLLRAQRVGDDGRTLEGPAFTSAMRIEPSSGGRRAFRSLSLEIDSFAPGTWRFSIDVQGKGAEGTLEDIGSRNIAFTNVAPEPRMRPASMAFTLLSFFTLLFLAGSPSRWRWLVLALAVPQPLLMSRGLLPSVPQEARFDLSQTERIVHAQIGAHRLMAGPGTFPGDTSLLMRIPLANGRTALEPAASQTFRVQSLKPAATSPAAGDVDDVDATSSALRLLGVSMLTSTRRSDPSGFEVIAGPDGASPMQVEAFIYRAHAPLPRAFCVTRVVDPRAFAAHDPLQDPSFDPEHEVFLDQNESWRPASPATVTRVDLGERSSDRLRLRADVDGDALLVLTDAASPGWIARVDGKEQRVLTADGLFRAVPIARGPHTIDFEYAPASWRITAWMGGLSLAAILALVSFVRRPRGDPAPHPAS